MENQINPTYMTEEEKIEYFKNMSERSKSRQKEFKEILAKLRDQNPVEYDQVFGHIENLD